MTRISIQAEHCMVSITADRMAKNLERAWNNVIACIQENFTDTIHFNYACVEKFDLSVAPNDLLFRLIRKSVYNVYADKKRFPQLLLDAGLSSIAPITCTSVGEAIDYSEIEIWFSKNRYGTAGKDMVCVGRQELPHYTLPQFHILQSQVDDICLIDGRKFTARFYLLVWNRKTYLYKGGFIVVHGVPFDSKSTDYDVQINHSDYEKKEGLASIQPLARFQHVEQYWPTVEKTAQTLTRALTDLLDASSNTDYIMLGVDYLFQNNQQIKIIEVNAIPNFVHTKQINETVNIPFITACLSTMLGKNSDDLTCLD